MRYLLLLIPTCLLGGCYDRKDESWMASQPSKLYTANGFTFGFYGGRATGYAPDAQHESIDPSEIGEALEVEAIQLAVKSGMDIDSTIARMRSMVIHVVDDYSFPIGSVYAAGLHQAGVIYVALWARGEVALESSIPSDAPSWTIQPPHEAYGWRFGSKPLVPAADHELGHEFFGPSWEH
jgi:hypothetical protein